MIAFVWISLNKIFMSNLIEKMLLDFPLQFGIFLIMQIDHGIIIQLAVLYSQIIEGGNGFFDKVKDLLAMDVERLVNDEDC